VVAERRNTESVSQHELQILRETQLQLSSTGNGSAVQEGLRLREGTNECVDRGLFNSRDFNAAMHIHPTVSEFIPTMMDQLKPLQ
jgi:hypothetical protein